ncbi:MAG: hypothetical protein JWM59_2146 [Verrucomicrobiales bacterium]|nr:hypothetical protein [Verrucomicrobiales bacterium]
MAGKWGPVLVLGGVLLSAGLIVHFDDAGPTSASRGTAASGSLNPGNSASGTKHSTNTTGAKDGGSLPDISRAFLDSPHYKAALSVAGMPDGPTRAEAMEALIETWAASAPEDAADWAGTLPAGNFRDDALSAVMFHWGLSAPADAASWLARTGVDDPEAASVLAGQWAAQDAASAAVWSEKLTDPVLRQDAINAVAGAWGARTPEAAAVWVTGLPAAGKAAAVPLVAAWAQTSPEAAAAWLARQQDAGQESQTAAVAVLATTWAEKNPGAASRFVNSLPEGPVREAASSQFAVAAAPTAPAEALTWAMNLTDPVQRNQVVADAAQSWYEGAPEGFRTGISDALALMDDPAMRKSVYEMLYERDAGFHDNLLKLIEPASPAQAASTLSSPSTATPPASFVPESTPAAGLDSGASSDLPGPFFPGQIPIPDTVPPSPGFTGGTATDAAQQPQEDADTGMLFPDDSGEADPSPAEHSS